jgi:membrane-associated phospholipid phosphatase
MLVKTSTLRVRPYVYNDEVPLDKKLDDEARQSFFSGHTSISAVNSFFLAKVFADYYPGSPWRPLTWGVAAAIPAFTGWMRVRAGKHFATDVMAGYAFGALLGYFIPHMHRVKVGSGPMTLALQPYNQWQTSGLSLVVRFN